MSIVISGDVEDVLHAAQNIGKLVHLDEVAKTNEREITYIWSSRSLVPETLVFVDPPLKYLNPKELNPRADRCVAFTAPIPKQWQEWTKLEGVTYQHYEIDPDKLIFMLHRGSEKLGIPKFELEAAKHLVQSNPGGRLPVLKTVEGLKLMGLKEPISYKDVVSIWPFIPTIGKAYSLSLSTLIYKLGSVEAVKLASKVAENEAYSALSGLEIACKKRPDRVELIRMVLKGVKDKRWRAKAALMIFTHLCLSEKVSAEWESKSQKEQSLSTVAQRVHQLSNTNWLLS